MPSGGSETGLSTWASNGTRVARRLYDYLGARPESPTLPILRLRGFSGLKARMARKLS